MSDAICKSRHCVGDLSCLLADFGYIILHNYFEAAHAKGEQDAAGSHIKTKVSQAVLRRTATIKNAKSMYQFLVEHFSQPAPSSFLEEQVLYSLNNAFFPMCQQMGKEQLHGTKVATNSRKLWVYESGTVSRVQLSKQNSWSDSICANVPTAFQIKKTNAPIRNCLMNGRR